MGDEQENRKYYGQLLRVPSSLIQFKGIQAKEPSFAQDGENILYSIPFRNLSAKTQVFNSNAREYLRTRLTHTLEVARIAVNMAEMLGFDGKLAEAIALGHDLGHTPFGHVGERVIHKFSSGGDRKYTNRDGEPMVMPENMRGFKHNLQSVRLLVDYTIGCRFSNFVLYGIREHSSKQYKKLGDKGKTAFYDHYGIDCNVVLNDERQIPAWSAEAFFVRWADEIAQRHHDIEDAYFQKIMSPLQIVKQLKGLSDLAETEKLRETYKKMIDTAKAYEELGDKEREIFSQYLVEFVIGTYLLCSVKEFGSCLKKVVDRYQIESAQNFEKKYPEICEQDVKRMVSLNDTPIGRVDNELNASLKYAILDSYEVQRMDGRSEYIVRRLLRAYKSNPQQLPNMYINRLMKEEIYQSLSTLDTSRLMDVIKEKLRYDTTDSGIRQWQDYECRNALRIVLENLETEKIISPVMMRIIFDYVAFMTDRSAYEEYKELYE